MDHGYDGLKAFVEDSILLALQHRSGISNEDVKALGYISYYKRHLINNLCRGDRSYLEIGGLIGASAIAAGSNHKNKVYTVDDFSYWEQVDVTTPDLRGEDVHGVNGLTQKQGFITQVQKAKVDVTLYEADAMHVVPDVQVDVFMYDGDHDAWVTERCLRRYIPVIQPKILLVDDFYSGQVQAGVFNAQLKPRWEWYTPFDNGFYVAIL